MFALCKFLLIASIIMLAYSAAAQGEVIATAKAAEYTADMLMKKDIVWISLFVACAAIGGMIVLGKFMKEMHLEFMKQTIEGTKAIGALTAEISAMRSTLNTMIDHKHR